MIYLQHVKLLNGDERSNIMHVLGKDGWQYRNNHVLLFPRILLIRLNYWRGYVRTS